MFKKMLLGLILSVVLATPAFASEFNSNLRFGMSKNKDVMKLQEFLTEESLYSGPISGNFFSLTLKAVKVFQVRENISPASGLVGPLTRVRINAILDSKLAEQEVEVINYGIPAPVEPKTTDDVVTKLQEQTQLITSQNQTIQAQAQILQNQLAEQQRQNQLLQEQIRQQQEAQARTEQAINQIVSNTTPVAPEVVVPPTLNPSLVIDSESSHGGVMKKFKFLPIDDDFKINILIASHDDKDSLNRMANQQVIENQSNGYKFTLHDCTGVKELFLEFSNTNFGYECPSNAKVYTSKDWLSRDVSEVVLEKNRKPELYLPSGANIFYLKVIGVNSGKIFEFTNI